MKPLLALCATLVLAGCLADGGEPPTTSEPPSVLEEESPASEEAGDVTANESRKTTSGGSSGIVCGDGSCNVHTGCEADMSCCYFEEDCSNCEVDCPCGDRSKCGDGICQPTIRDHLIGTIVSGEDEVTCPEDCRTTPDCRD